MACLHTENKTAEEARTNSLEASIADLLRNDTSTLNSIESPRSHSAPRQTAKETRMPPQNTVHDPVDSPNYESDLSHGPQRFLALVVEHGLHIGRRKPEDFLRFFPPRDIMNALAEEPEQRATILELTTGIRRKIGLRKSPVSAGEDLQFALDEDETDATTIVELFKPDERVRKLPAAKLWDFVCEGDFWQSDSSDIKDPNCRKRHIAFILAQAIENGILSAVDIVQSIGLDNLGEHLPKSLLVQIMTRTLEKAQSGQPFGEVDLLTVVPPMTLAEHLPASLIWERVIAIHIPPSLQISSSSSSPSSGSRNSGSGGSQSGRNREKTPARPSSSATLLHSQQEQKQEQLNTAQNQNEDSLDRSLENESDETESIEIEVSTDFAAETEQFGDREQDPPPPPSPVKERSLRDQLLKAVSKKDSGKKKFFGKSKNGAASNRSGLNLQTNVELGIAAHELRNFDELSEHDNDNESDEIGDLVEDVIDALQSDDGPLSPH